MPFPFENITIYQTSLTFVARVNSLPTSHRYRLKRTVADQLGRASLSIPLNIAEGSGRYHDGEKKQFFRIARGSIFECVAIIQAMKCIDEIDEADFDSCYSTLVELSKMISGMLKAIEVRSA